MERLSFTSKFAYNATEAAIHMARYQIAAPFCRDARVLDIACGEGYGALALKRFGAATVEAVDSSADAINTARKLFRTAGVNHHVGDAARVDEMFRSAEFDVIVSLETIEHLADPERFLRALMRVAKRDAVIIISCPNDNWYYPTPDQSNPFHVRKYSFEEFRVLTTKVLGTNVAWGYGVPMVGFGNVTDDELAGRDQLMGQAMMLDFTPQTSAITLPQRQFSDVGPRTCSYFIGVWGAASKAIHSAALVPISMDQFANIVSWETAGKSPQQLITLEAEKSELSTSLTGLHAQLAEVTSALAKQRDEREALARDLGQLQEQRTALEVQLARTAAESAHETAKAIALTLELERERAGHAKIRTDFASVDAAASQAQTRAQSLAQLLESERYAHTHSRQEVSETRSRLAALEAERNELQSAHAALEATSRSLGQELAEKQSEAATYRIRALALAKELDVATAARQQAPVIDWEAAMAQLRAQAAAHQDEATRFRDQAASLDTEIAGLRQSLSTLDDQLAEQTRRADGYRVQIVALSKELNLATEQVQTLAGQLKQAQEQASTPVASIEVARVALPVAEVPPFAAPDLDAIRREVRAELEPEFEVLRGEAERHRVQAMALAREIEVMTRPADQTPASNTSMPVLISPIVPKRSIIRSGKYRIRHMAARVKPMLPDRVVGMARRVARKLKI